MKHHTSERTPQQDPTLPQDDTPERYNPSTPKIPGQNNPSDTPRPTTDPNKNPVG